MKGAVGVPEGDCKDTWGTKPQFPGPPFPPYCPHPHSLNLPLLGPILEGSHMPQAGCNRRQLAREERGKAYSWPGRRERTASYFWPGESSWEQCSLVDVDCLSVG